MKYNVNIWQWSQNDWSLDAGTFQETTEQQALDRANEFIGDDAIDNPGNNLGDNFREYLVTITPFNEDSEEFGDNILIKYTNQQPI